MDDPTQPTVLVLNTSQPVPQLGVWYTDAWQYRLNPGQQTSHTILFTGLHHSGLTPHTLTDVIICIGPGSYTGLRTGASMCHAIQLTHPSVRLWPVIQFQLMVPAQDAWVLLPALRHTGYVARLHADHTVSQPQSVDTRDWTPPDDAPLWVHPAMAGYKPDSPVFDPPEDTLGVALRLWQQGRLTQTQTVTPLYIHPPKITPPKPLS